MEPTPCRIDGTYVVLSGCASGSQPLPYMQGGAALRVLDSTGAGKITHIVYIIQENRKL